MNYQEEYRRKLVSAKEAVSVVKSGDWVDYGWTTGTPDATLSADGSRLVKTQTSSISGAAQTAFSTPFPRLP